MDFSLSTMLAWAWWPLFNVTVITFLPVKQLLRMPPAVMDTHQLT